MIHPSYDCSSVFTVRLGEPCYEHRCIRKDQQVAATVLYSSVRRRCSPPILHERTGAQEPDANPDCHILQGPCLTQLSFLDTVFIVPRLNQVRGHDTDPPAEFWNLLIGWLENKDIPWSQ